MSQQRLEERLKRYFRLCNRKKRFFRTAVHLARTLRIPLSAFVGFHNRASSDFGGMGPVGDEHPKSRKHLFHWGRRNYFDYARVTIIGDTFMDRKIAKRDGLPEPVGRRVCIKDRPRTRGQINRHLSLHK